MKYIIDHDYHIHSNLSLCSKDPLQTTKYMLNYAEQNSLLDICLTDHFWDERVPGAEIFGFYKEQDYEHLNLALPLPESHSVIFYFGCEAEMDKHMRIGLSQERFEQFDFVIIPTTHLHMPSFTIDEADDSLERRAYLYAERLHKLLDMDLPFEKIGIAHLTCSLIANKQPADHIKVLELISDATFFELYGKIADRKAGSELNFPIFKYDGENLDRILRPYRIAKKCGCKFYLGSDAHHPKGLDTAVTQFEAIIDALDLTESDKFTPFFRS
ncbi:MAG: hypothetical protein GX173_03540 [Ruminococcaceae bacterium]|nr:hypothetical protein [Oscillospiraceae bacterium]